MKEKLDGVKRKSGPLRGLLAILIAAAGFLLFLVALTALVRLIMA